MTLHAHAEARPDHEEAADRGRQSAPAPQQRATLGTRQAKSQGGIDADLRTAYQAEPHRQLGFISDATMIADQLRGLRYLFKTAFCDGVGTAELDVVLVDASVVVVSCLESFAARLDGLEQVARASLETFEVGAGR